MSLASGSYCFFLNSSLCWLMEPGDYLQIREKYETVEGICDRLHTDSQSGLSGNLDDLCQRRKEFGRNELPETKSKTFLQLVLAAVSDKVLIGLLTVATLVIIFGCVKFENGQSASNVRHAADALVQTKALMIPTRTSSG